MYIKLVTNNFFSAILRALISVLFLFCSLHSFTQLQYNFERINTENGLPTNAIKGLIFDSSSRFLWVATESGIVRYNSHGFQSFGDNEKTVVLNGRIVFFDKTNAGKIYGKLIDERIFTIKGNIPYIEDKAGMLKTEADFLRYKHNITDIVKDSLKIDIDIRDYFVNNNIYTKIDFRLYKYVSSRLQLITLLPNDETGFVLNDHLFFLRKDGVFFEGLDKNGSFNLIQIENLSKELKYDSKNAFSQVKLFQTHPNEPVYLIASNKLYNIEYVNNKLKLNIITDQVPINEFVKYIQIDDKTKIIYIGTDNRGLIVGRPKYFNRILPINAIDGVSSSAYAQVLLKNGDIQINNGQIYKGSSTLSKSLSSSIFDRPSETSTFISKDSFLYFSNFEGVIKYDLKKGIVVEKSNDIAPTRNAFIEFNNKLYSFDVNGIAIKNAKWEYLLKLSNMPFNFIVYSLMQVNDHEILAATTNGLYKYNVKLNTFNLFYKEKSDANFRAIFNLSEHYLLGTYGGGIYMYRNDTIKKLPLDQNGYLNYTHCFIMDNKGRIWASTNKGLFMSPSKSLIDFWNLGPGNIKFSYFGKPEGIDELEMNGGCSPCAIKLGDGRFSFPGIDGLIQFHPDSLPEVSIQPKVYLDKLILDGKVCKVELSNKELNASIKNIELQLGISGMLSQENIMLEYKYDDEPWVRVNVKSPNLKFSNPGYGAHKVTIRIRNTINDKWETNTYGFSINYPWYLNPYVFIIYFFISIGMVLLYIRFKTIIYQRRQKILEKEVDAKTQTLNKLNENLLKRNQAKDHVIAIMNHDILTPLKYLHITAKNIAETSNEEKIKKSINQIAKTSKDLEYLTSNMLNWVKFDNIETLPNRQTVDLYSLTNDLVEFVKPFKQNEQVQIINEIPDGLIIQNWADSLRVLLYNLIVNAINNTQTGTIKISYSGTSNGYKISVTDTGIGMNDSMIQYLLKGKNKDEIEQIPKYKKGNGVGFQIIRNIVLLMNATIEIESQETKGTTVSIFFISYQI